MKNKMEAITNLKEIERTSFTYTFKKIDSFDEMLRTPTEEIVYLEQEEWSDGSYIFTAKLTKNYTWLHKHPYYNLNYALMEKTIVNRGNFHTCRFNFYKVISNKEVKE